MTASLPLAALARTRSGPRRRQNWGLLRAALALCAATVGPVAIGQADHAVPTSIRFNRDVRPILSENCFQCHGPDAKRRQADLRLDTAEGVLAAFTGGLDASSAWQRITSSDPAEKMPPAESHRELTAAQIELLRLWVLQGAPFEGHWSFQPLQAPKIPAVLATAPDLSAPINPIDAFLAQRWQQEQLSPNGEADRERLLRRVTFDVTGLPPQIADIDAFLADSSPQAYEKVVDRLLASQHFGERMAVAWLDAARYGDTSVFHADGPRDMWPWRDWVIRAYNENKPFDQFTVEQLAGDLLPHATADQKTATGFNRNNATTDEGGAIAEEFRVEYAVDRVKTTSLVWLGLTMECAQCHDHKYDPISQQDYYRFFAYFNQSADPGMQTRGGNQAPTVPVHDAVAMARAEQMKQRVAEIESLRAARRADSESGFAAWAAQAHSDPIAQQLSTGLQAYATLDDPPAEVAGDTAGATQPVHVEVANVMQAAQQHGDIKSVPGRFAQGREFPGDAHLVVADAGSWERDQAFSWGAWVKIPSNGGGAVVAKMDDQAQHRGYDLLITDLKPAVHLIHRWPDNAIKVQTKEPISADVWQHVFVTYDGSSQAAGVQIYVDGVLQECSVEQNSLSDSIQTAQLLHLGRRSVGSPLKGTLDDVRLYSRRLNDTEVAELVNFDPVSMLLAKPSSEWTAAERSSLIEFYLSDTDPEFQALNRELAQLQVDIRAAEKPISTVMVMEDLATPRMTYVLDRGNYQSPREDQPVEPGTPAFLPALDAAAPANRLGLAQWLVRPDHPLTARVTINRLWEMFMGSGLVRTVEDFGAAGETPSHPELLDWLAADFVSHGWDVKRSIKMILMSQAYRRSAKTSPTMLQADPENRLFARGPRFRLTGEFIRDNALAASGLLVPTIGGPSVKPYQPPGLWEEVSISSDKFVQDHGDKLYRRSLYTYLKRSAPAPTMQIFDGPTREKCVLRRSRTNTPLQALVTLNDPQFVEAARTLAQRALLEGGATRAEQITFAYRRATGLRPSPLALQTLLESYEHEREVFRADVARATSLLAVGESPRDPSLDAAEHAAMTLVCSLILNLDQTVTRG